MFPNIIITVNRHWSLVIGQLSLVVDVLFWFGMSNGIYRLFIPDVIHIQITIKF